MKQNFKRKLMAGLLSACMMLQTAGLVPVYAAGNAADSGVTANPITAFAPLAQSEYTLPIGADEATIANVLVFPKTIKATVNKAEIDLSVTWESDKAISTEKADTFAYTAKLTDEGYTLAEGISLPTITVAVEGVMAQAPATLTATDPEVLKGVYAADSGIKPDLAVTYAESNTQGDAYWGPLQGGGIRTQALRPNMDVSRCASINVRFALPEDAYYSTAFEVYTCKLPAEATSFGTAGGYIMNYPAGNRAPEGWGIEGDTLAPAKYPYVHNRVDPQDKWELLAAAGQKGGTVTLMAGIAERTKNDLYDYGKNIYIGFRNLRVNRLDTKLNVSTASGGTFDVAVALEGTNNATKQTTYEKTIGRGASVTVTARPDTGYYFENWVDGNGTELSRNAQYTFESATSATDASDKTVKAVFMQGADSRATLMLEAGAQNMLNENNFSFYANGGWIFKDSYDGKRGAFAEHNTSAGLEPQKRVLSYRINAPENGTLYATLIRNKNIINVLIDGKPVETAQIPQGDNNTVYFHSPITKGEHIVTFDATVDNGKGHTFIYDVGIAKDVTITPAAASGILGCKSYTLNVNDNLQTLNGSAIKVPYNSLIEVEMVPEDITSYTFMGWDTGNGAIKLVPTDGSTWQQNGRAKAIAKGDIAFTPVFEAALNVGARFQRDTAEKAPDGSAYAWKADHGWTAGTLTTSSPFPEIAPHESIEFVYDGNTNPTASLSLPLTIPEGEPCMISFLAQNAVGFSIAKIAEGGSENIEYNQTLTVPNSGKCYFTVLNPGKYMLKWTGNSTASSLNLADFTCKKTSEWTIGKITTNVYTQTSIGVDTKVNDQLHIKALPSFIYPKNYATMAYNNTINTPQQVIFDISETASARTYQLDTSKLSMKLKAFKFTAQNTDTALSVADGQAAGTLDVSYQALKMEQGGITLDIWLNDTTGAPEVDTATNTVYGNGTPLFICKNDATYNEIWTYNTATQKKVDLLHTVTSGPSATVYGGAKDGALTADTYIKTDAGSDLNYITLYGGNENGQLNGNATIECNCVKGATINGGSKNGSFVGNSTITMLAGKSSTCDITAGNVQGEAAITIHGTVQGQVDGGAAMGKVNITVAKTGSLTLDTVNSKKTQSIIGATVDSKNAVEINIKQGAQVEGEIRGFAEGINAKNANVAINLSSNTGSKIYTGIYTGGAVTVNILKTYTKDIYVSAGKKAPQLTPELKGEGAYFKETTAAGYDQYKYTDTSKPFVDAAEKTIYCNGIKTKIWQQQGNITIEYVSNGATKTLTCDGRLSSYTIYGGAKNTPVASTDVTVGSAVKTYAPKAIYGGGSGAGATVEGDTKLTLVNQNAKTSYGGGKNGDVKGNAVINLQDINYFDSVYTNTAYAGGEFGKVTGTATINYDTHMIGRMTELYGLSNNAGADVGGKITVNLAGSATVKVYLPQGNAQAVGPKGETDFNFIGISAGVSSNKSVRNPMMYEVQTKILTKTDTKNKVTLYANGYPLLITDDGCYFDLNQNSVADGGDKPCPTDNAYTTIYAGADDTNVASVFLSIQSKNSSLLTVYADCSRTGSVTGDVTLCVAGTVANADVRNYSVSGNATFCLGSPTGGETFISGKGYDLKSFKKLVVYQPFNCPIQNFPVTSELEDNLDQSKYQVKREGTTCTTVDLLKPDDGTIEVKDTFDDQKTYTGHLVAFYDQNNGSRIAFDKNRNGVYDSGDEMCAVHYNEMVIKGVGSTLTMHSWQAADTTVTLWNGTSFTMNGGTLSKIQMEDTQLSNDVNIKLNDGTYSNISIKGYNSTGGDVHCQMNGGTWNISSNAMSILNDPNNTQNPSIKIGAGVTLGGTGSLGIANNGKVSLDMSALKDPLSGGKNCYATGTNGCKGIVPPTGYDWGAVDSGKYPLAAQKTPIPQFPVTAVCTETKTLELKGVSGAASLSDTSTAIKASLSNNTVTITGTNGPDYQVVTVYDSAGKTIAYIMITMVQKEVQVTVNKKITSPVGQKNAWDKAYFTLSVSGTGTEDELMLTAKNALTVGTYDLMLNKTASNNKCYHYTLTNGANNLEKTALPTITAGPATMLGDSAGTGGWYRDFVWITPPAGYLISTEKEGVYTAKLMYKTSSPNTQAVQYFLKDNGSTSATKGHTTDAMSIAVKLSNETNFATFNNFATSNITGTGATVSGNIVLSGECGLDTLYILPVTDGTPTAAQVKAGTAMTVAKNSATANLTGLKGGTTYQLYVLPISQSGVCSQPIKLGEVKTIALKTTVTVKPTASAVYGTALAGITLSGGTVTANGNANVAGTWAWTQANSSTILPEVGGTTTYKATFTPTDSMYEPVTAQVTPVVAAKTVTITPNAGQRMEYGAASGLTYTTGDSGAEASITGALALANKNVGTQNITIGTLASSSANYTLVLSEPTVTATVTQRPVVLSWTNSTGFIYNATERSVTATISNKVNSDDVTVATYSDNTGTNVGTYHAQALTLKGEAKGNYTLVGVSNAQTLTITAATPTVAVTAEKKVSRLISLGNHDDTITLKATVTGVTGGTVPTGTVTFKSGATTIASTVEVKNGVATYEWVKPDAAKHTITVEFAAAANTNYADATGTSTAFDIDKANQAALNISGVPSSVTYGDGNFTLSTTGGSGNGAVAYTVTAGNAVSVVESTGAVTVLKAGTATITATKAGGTNYNDATARTTITVNAAVPTIAWANAAESLGYTGSAAVITAPTVTLVKGESFNGTIQYAYKKTGLSTVYTDGLPTNAGEYEIKAKIAAEGNYTQAETATALTLTIEKSTPTLAISSYTGKTYDGTAMANPTAENMTITGAAYAELTFAYSKDSNMSSPLTAAPKDAGTYYVQASVVAGDNSNAASSAAVSFTITKANVTGVSQEYPVVKTLAKEYTFDLSKLLPSISSTQEYGSVTYAVASTVNANSVLTAVPTSSDIVNGELTLKVANVATNDQTATVTISITSDNFTVTNAVITVKTVDKIPLKISNVTMVERMYNGSAYAYTGTPTFTNTTDDKAVTGVSFTTEYEGRNGTSYTKSETAPTNAGEYNLILTVSGASADTYAGTLTVSFTIGKAFLDIKAENKSMTKGGEVPSFTYTATGLTNGDTVTTAPKMATVADGKTTGTFDITISGGAVANDANYNITYTKGTLTVSTDNGGGSSATYYTITATAGAGGSISTGKSVSVREGDSAGFTMTPDKGYTIADVKVNGKSVGAVKNYVFTNVRSNQTIEATFKASGGHVNPQTGVPFEDVAENDWFYESVYNAVEKGWFAGTSDKAFTPNSATTRGMIAAVLLRMETKPTATAASIFEDVASEAYYASGVTWAQENGIVGGYGNGNFGPQDNITREQMAAILYRYAQFKNYDVSKTTSLDSFSDAGSVSNYAVESMKWAVANGLIAGNGNGILDPKGSATRAQVAAILTRFDELFSEK